MTARRPPARLVASSQQASSPEWGRHCPAAIRAGGRPAGDNDCPASRHHQLGAGAGAALADRGLSVCGRLERPKRQPQAPMGGVHSAHARPWVGLSPLRMWVLPDSLPACRGPTMACMGFFDDGPASGSEPLRARAGRGSAGPARRRRRTALVRLPVVDPAGRECRPWLRAACGATLTGAHGPR
jgi:hypothetical protein